MSAFTVPAIDISAYIGEGSDEERREIARQIDEAARTVGFMQITGHGIPLETWQRLGRAIDRFFALPLEEKKRYRAPKGINRGYSPPKSERLSYSLGVEKAAALVRLAYLDDVAGSSADPASLVSMLEALGPLLDSLGASAIPSAIDPQRRLQLHMCYAANTGRNFYEIIRALDALQLTAYHQVATPANWNQGEDVIIVPSVSNEEAEEKYPAGWSSPKPYLRIVSQPE